MIRSEGKRAKWRDLRSHILTKKVIICVGAGGVGKTTLAAAIAVRAAISGRRTVCLTIDPAKRLADSLGVSLNRRSGELTDITSMLGEAGEPRGRLSFGMLDPVETFNKFVEDKTSSPRKAEQILNNKLYKYISGSLSGMREYMALEKLNELASCGEFDLIVLDTPPTANALDFFTAPSRMVEALDGPFVRMMRRAYVGPGKIGFDIIGKWAQLVLRTVSRVTGADLLDEIMGFVDALSDLFGSFSTRAKTVEKVLRGDSVSFCLITTPDKATFKEAMAFHTRLRQLGFAVNAVVFNRAHWPRVDAPLDLLRNEESRHYVKKLNQQWNLAHQREVEFVKRVRDGLAGLESVAAVPLLPDGGTRLESLLEIGRYI